MAIAHPEITTGTRCRSARAKRSISSGIELIGALAAGSRFPESPEVANAAGHADLL